MHRQCSLADGHLYGNENYTRPGRFSAPWTCGLVRRNLRAQSRDSGAGFLPFLPPFPLKRSLEFSPSPWRPCLRPSVKETRPNNAEIVRICVLFAFSRFSVNILPLRFVAATVPTPSSRPHPSTGPVESLSPCALLPHTLPLGSPPILVAPLLPLGRQASRTTI